MTEPSPRPAGQPGGHKRRNQAAGPRTLNRSCFCQVRRPVA